jgi:uncharacterized protein (DUF2249 family)
MSNSNKQIDVRKLPPRDKHPTIFSTIDNLKSGDSLELINDHDPKPLQYQLTSEHPDMYEWKYLEQGPEVWRVTLTKR